MKRTSVAIFALLSAIAPASAADLYGNSSLKDPITSSLSFIPSGLYASVSVGAGLTDTSAKQGTLDPDFNFAGFLGEARVGYDMRQGNWVAGPFVGVSFEDVKGKTDLELKNATGNQSIGYEVGARLGRVLNNSSLLYGLVAFQGQHIGLNNTSFTADLSGLKVGGGLEIDLSDGLFFKSEADYVWYGDWNPAGAGLTINENEIRTTFGLGKRF